MKVKTANLLLAFASAMWIGVALVMGISAYVHGGNNSAIVISSANSSNSTYIYCVGDSGNGAQNRTFYAQITPNRIGQWSNTTSYPVGVDDVGCDIYNNYIYCTGTNATQQENQSYFAKLYPTGIGNWTATTPYPFPASYQSCSAYRGYIYCVGDWWYPKQNATEYAPISNNGIGQWVNSTPYPQPFYWGTCSINNGYIYCIGGKGVKHSPGEDDSIVAKVTTPNETRTFFAPVSDKGIGQWEETTPYPVPFTLDGCPIYNNKIYCLGADNSTGHDVWYANVSSSGIGSWIPTNSTPVGFIQTGCDIYAGHIYCVGSRDPNSKGHQTWYAPIQSDGGIGKWTATTPFPIPFYGDSYCEIPGSGGGWTSGGGPQN